MIYNYLFIIKFYIIYIMININNICKLPNKFFRFIKEFRFFKIFY